MLQESITRKIYTFFNPKSQLDLLIKDAVQNRQAGGYGIYTKNLTTGETAGINIDSEFETASLYKLWVAGALYQQIEDGSIKPQDSLSSSKYDLYKKMEIEFEKEEEEKLKEEKVESSVSDALTRMITVSDNDSAYLLTDKVGFDNIREFLKNYGFSNSTIGNPPTSTPKEIGSYFEKLYKGEIVDKQKSNELIVLLKSQRINDRIPKLLPNTVAVAHKTGELGGLKHDAGIVYAKNPYILVILTNTNNPVESTEFSAQLSRQVYDYYKKTQRDNGT